MNPMLHLKLPVEPDKRRAELMGVRFVEGLRSLDAEGRRSVFKTIGAHFCTRCGADKPACRCRS